MKNINKSFLALALSSVTIFLGINSVFATTDTTDTETCSSTNCSIATEEGTSIVDEDGKIVPYYADVDSCTSSAGRVYPTTKEGYANWFIWGGCARNKYYTVTSGEEITLKVKTDSCASCMCYHPKFNLYELSSSGTWELKEEYDLPAEKGYTKTINYTPDSSKVRIEALSCFYLDIYKVEAEEDQEETSIAKCIDSDGINYFKRGSVYDTGHPGTFNNSDKCLSDTKLLEYTCKNDAWYATYYECPGECSKGVCVEKEQEENAEKDGDEDNVSSTLPEGTLIKLPDDSKVYVIKNGERVWIRTSDEFKALGYKWQDIKTVSANEIKQVKERIREETKLIKGKKDKKVYRLENGKLIWVPTVAAFNAQGLKWEEVEEEEDTALEQYEESRLVKDGEGNIYYITNNGRKKLIVNMEVFESYQNKLEDVVEVSEEVLDSMEDVELVREKGDPKVYKIENGQKKWIKTIQAFQRLGLNWEDIDTVNETEINAYEEAQDIG
ncbi:MAG: hypothetical protein PHI66_00555 [Candidatus Pacebacteria bacterium]|nr:hypothetical protein [Candidatus Paceibacterota bacterium]